MCVCMCVYVCVCESKLLFLRSRGESPSGSDDARKSRLGCLGVLSRPLYAAAFSRKNRMAHHFVVSGLTVWVCGRHFHALWTVVLFRSTLLIVFQTGV